MDPESSTQEKNVASGIIQSPVDSTGLWNPSNPILQFFSCVEERARPVVATVWKPTSSYNLKCWRWSQSPKHKRKMGLQGLSTALWTQQPNRAVDNPSTGGPPALFFNPYVHKRELDHSKEMKNVTVTVFLWVRRCADVRFLVRTSAHQHSHRKPTSLSRTGEEPGCQTPHM